MSIIETERIGKITGFYDLDTGSIEENVTLKEFDFAQIGAQLLFQVGDEVIFITIKTPGGREIVKQVIKK